MSAFDETKKIETEGMYYLLPFVRYHALNGQFVVIDKGPLAEFLQSTIGDLLVNGKQTEQLWSVEVKCERKNNHGNFFLEEWSNMKWSKPGWMKNNLRADFLWYFFIKEQELYVMNLNRLRDWAYNSMRINDFPLKEQKKYDQLNDTWGRCVPISIIENECGLKKFNINHNQLSLFHGISA